MPDQAIQQQQLEEVCLPEQKISRIKPQTVELQSPQEPHTLSSVPQWLRSTTLAGRLTYCVQSWRQVTSDPWVLQTVQGYHIKWAQNPFQVFPTISYYGKISSKSYASRGDSEPAPEKSTGSSSFFSKTIHKQIVPGIQKGRNLPTCDQPETFHSEESFQNRRDKDDKGCITSRGLDKLSGFKGCVLISTYNKGSQKVPEIYLGLTSSPTCLWALQCPSYIHKTLVAHDGAPADATA